MLAQTLMKKIAEYCAVSLMIMNLWHLETDLRFEVQIIWITTPIMFTLQTWGFWFSLEER